MDEPLLMDLRVAPTAGPGKHLCPDCRMCQWCADTRCRACRGPATKKPRLSMAEQIARYDELNRNDLARPDLPVRIK